MLDIRALVFSEMFFGVSFNRSFEVLGFLLRWVLCLGGGLGKFFGIRATKEKS